MAYLISEGAVPGRILLITFSPRAAQEMERRIERILTDGVKGTGPADRSEPLAHATAGARLLRDFAHSIGLTIHDREDSADLLNLVRHQMRFSEQEQRFPLKATCLAIYSRAVNSGDALGRVLAKNFRCDGPGLRFVLFATIPIAGI